MRIGVFLRYSNLQNLMQAVEKDTHARNVHQLCRLQGLLGTLLYIVRLQQVTEVTN